jgi:hypothetical protein
VRYVKNMGGKTLHFEFTEPWVIQPEMFRT